MTRINGVSLVKKDLRIETSYRSLDTIAILFSIEEITPLRFDLDGTCLIDIMNYSSVMTRSQPLDKALVIA